MKFLAQYPISLLYLFFGRGLVNVEQFIVVFRTKNKGDQVEEQKSGEPQHCGAQLGAMVKKTAEPNDCNLTVQLEW